MRLVVIPCWCSGYFSADFLLNFLAKNPAMRDEQVGGSMSTGMHPLASIASPPKRKKEEKVKCGKPIDRWDEISSAADTVPCYRYVPFLWFSPYADLGNLGSQCLTPNVCTFRWPGPPLFVLHQTTFFHLPSSSICICALEKSQPRKEVEPTYVA